MSKDIKNKYQELPIDFSITPELNNAIHAFLKHINEEDGHNEDCYRDEIESWLKDAFEILSTEQFRMLYDYYVLGDIYRKGV